MADHLCPLRWVWPLLSDHSPVWYLIVLITADVLSVCREAQSDLGRLFLIQITLYSSIFIFTSKKVHIAALDVVLRQMWRYCETSSIFCCLQVAEEITICRFKAQDIVMVLLCIPIAPLWESLLQRMSPVAHVCPRRTHAHNQMVKTTPAIIFFFFLNELNQHILNFYLLVKIWGHSRKSPLKTERY